MARTKIEVTQEDINVGISGSCSFCPIAFAVRRTFNVHRVQVMANVNLIYDEGRYFQRIQNSRTLPTRAREFMRKFDKSGPTAVKPFKFWLDLP